MEKLNLDTGHATVKSAEQEKTGFCATRTTETVEKEMRILGLKAASQEVSFKQTQEGLLGTKQAGVHHDAFLGFY